MSIPIGNYSESSPNSQNLIWILQFDHTPSHTAPKCRPNVAARLHRRSSPSVNAIAICPFHQCLIAMRPYSTMTIILVLSTHRERPSHLIQTVSPRQTMIIFLTPRCRTPRLNMAKASPKGLSMIRSSSATPLLSTIPCKRNYFSLPNVHHAFSSAPSAQTRINGARTLLVMSTLWCCKTKHLSLCSTSQNALSPTTLCTTSRIGRVHLYFQIGRILCTVHLRRHMSSAGTAHRRTAIPALP